MSPNRGGDEPITLAEALAKVGAELGLAPGDPLGALSGRWNEVMGADVAPHTFPVSVREGVLTIGVRDPAWATQLRFLEPVVIERAGALLGDGVVTRVKVRIGGPREG